MTLGMYSLGLNGGKSMDEKIRLIGDIHYESNLQDGPGIRIVRDFMMRLIRGFSKQASSYIRVTDEVPFIFKERQLHSSLAPALAEFCDAFLMESPVNRNWSSISYDERNDSHGWVDYWCYFRKIAFLIEIKHGFISCKSEQIRSSVKEDWKIALRQLDAIEKEAKFQSEWTNGAFRIALNVLPLYETANIKEPNTVGNFDKLLSIQRDSIKQFEQQPNWSAMWILHKNLAGPYKYPNTVEYYPGVLFISHISEISIT